jgi:hypothetical protein
MFKINVKFKSASLKFKRGLKLLVLMYRHALSKLKKSVEDTNNIKKFRYKCTELHKWTIYNRCPNPMCETRTSNGWLMCTIPATVQSISAYHGSVLCW